MPDEVPIADDNPDDPIVAQSPAMRDVCALMAKVAPSDNAVLICGEPGVGKELVARAIHRQSRRAAHPFVHVPCGAIREADLELMLFSDEREGHYGLLDDANQGTLFLANVEHLPLRAQFLLCAVPMGGCTVPCSGVRPMPIDVRVIASTSSDLRAAVLKGRFSSEFYYHLSVVTLHVPPLRQRQPDIKILAERSLVQTLARQGVPADQVQYRFTPQACESLLNHDWPGNLPELASVVAHAVAMADGPLIGKEAIALLPRKVPRSSSEAISFPLTGNFREIERTIVEAMVQRCGGNKAAAARALGLHRRTLYRMLEEHAGGPGPAESDEDR